MNKPNLPRPATKPTHVGQVDRPAGPQEGAKMASLLQGGGLPEQRHAQVPSSAARAPAGSGKASTPKGGYAAAEEAQEPSQEELRGEITSGGEERLTQAEQQEMAQMLGLTGMMGYNLRQQIEAAKEVEAYRLRMEEIEKKVAPIQVTDLIFRDCVTQQVPIWDDLPVSFSSMSSALALACDNAAVKAASPWSGLKDSAATQMSLVNVARLAASCHGIGMRTPPHTPNTLLELAKSPQNAAKLLEALLENVSFWLEFDEAILGEIINHHAMFVVRLRKATNRSGEVAVKKS